MNIEQSTVKIEAPRVTKSVRRCSNRVFGRTRRKRTWFFMSVSQARAKRAGGRKKLTVK